VAGAYWDPKEECVCNKSDEMLNVAMSDKDGLYWEVEAIETLPAKRKKIKVDKESIMDSVSTVKTAISSVKTKCTTSHQQKHTDATPPTKTYYHPGCTNGGLTGLNDHTINRAGFNLTTRSQQNKLKA